MDNEYEIGYGKPPETTRFKTGKSGNPKGRPKGSKNTHKMLEEILSQKIEVVENGKPVKISKKAAALTQLVNKAVKGDTKAIATLIPHMQIADVKQEEQNQVMEALKKDDRAIIDAYYSTQKKAEV